VVSDSVWNEALERDQQEQELGLHFFFLLLVPYPMSSRANLLFKIVVGEEQDSIVAVQDTLCVLKILLDVTPADYA